MSDVFWLGIAVGFQVGFFFARYVYKDNPTPSYRRLHNIPGDE